MMTSADMEKQTMKASKPAMEKRRRARINESLQQLKALVLDGLNKNNSRHSKLEKADILEMTVRYLRNVQRQQVKASMETDPAVITQYRTGFAECMGEVSRYLGGAIEENPEVRARLIGHLAGFCASTNQRQQQQSARYAAVTSAQTQSPGTSRVQPPSSSTSPAVVMNSAPSSTPPSSVHQRHHSQQAPMQVGFPTPPLSNGGLPSHPVALMTSPAVEGARTRGAPQVLSAQVPQLPTQRLSPAKGTGRTPSSVPKAEVPVSEVKPPAMIAQILPASTTPQAPDPQPMGDMITLLLPSQSLPGGQVPTHLIPVYAQEPGKGVAPPLGYSFASSETVPSSTTPQSSGSYSNNPKMCAVSTPSPKVAQAAPAMVSPGQPAAWTAIPLPTAQLVSPQAGAVAPSSMAPPFAFSIPFNAKISPPGAAVQAKKPAEQMGRPIRLPGMFAVNTVASGDIDPMWRPW
ncbi:protein deadpan-like [Patiria miniata]|uniref:Uncharacterized protein n=1 Tax=Patiria miniata TaxID=46514 RepID=A0A914BS16_PATMI|nr:protein deadpan-like [Patiria miniata]